MQEIISIQIQKVDLKKLAKKKGWTIRQWADKADVNYAYLNRVVNGYHRLSMAYWLKLLNAYNRY